jgi:hypothetical protein
VLADNPVVAAMSRNDHVVWLNGGLPRNAPIVGLASRSSSTP